MYHFYAIVLTIMCSFIKYNECRMYHFYAIVLTIMCSFISYTFNKRGNCNEDIENGPVNRLSRFVLPESNKVNLSSETVFFETSSAMEGPLGRLCPTTRVIFLEAWFV